MRVCNRRDAIFGEVSDVVQEVKRGKRDGFSGLMSDHVINACDDLFIHISLLLSSMLVHGMPSDNLLVSIIHSKTYLKKPDRYD